MGTRIVRARQTSWLARLWRCSETEKGWDDVTQSLQRGDLVEVRSSGEILETLDERGALEELPFMPEMAGFCGRRFTVDSRSEKICDTIHWTGSRRLRETVLLDQGRCDGSAHGGCQAECRMFWKEAWLRRVRPDAPPAAASVPAEVAALLARTVPHTRHRIEPEGTAEERFRCQATDLPQATEQLKLADPRPYLRELTCGNVSAGRFLRVTGRALVTEPMRKLGLVPEVPLRGTRTKEIEDPLLGLQPGELVRVKSKEQIATTLSPAGRNRGLWFDAEMLPHCGRTFRVRQRVRRFINDRDGQMIELKTDAVTLEGVVCSGDLSPRRWFCPRAILPYWRECWLERVDPPASASDADAPQAAAASPAVGGGHPGA